MLFRKLVPGRREAVGAAALVLALTLIATAAGIAGGHMSGGAGWGSGLVFEGTAWGLGRIDGVLAVTVEATGTAPAECTNQGGNTAPGQVNVAVDGSSTGTWEIEKNGRAEGVSGEIFPELPPGIEWDDAGCPNSNWTVTGVVEDMVSWETVHAFGTTTYGDYFELFLTCTTFYREDGTTFGFCEE